jgi:uncharacterized protein (TIGR00369 family)
MDVEHGSPGLAGASGEWGPARSRSVSWYDPQVLIAGAVSRSGMEAMRAMRDGELPPPPVGRLVPGDLVHLEEGSVSYRCALDESMCNPMGLVAGGILCTMLDAALTCAVHTTLPQGVTHTSIELKVNFLRPVPLDSGPLDAVGTVIKPGRRIAFAEGKVTDRPGRTVATGSTSILLSTAPR